MKIVDININLIDLAKLDLTINEYLTILKVTDVNLPFRSDPKSIEGLRGKGWCEADDETIQLNQKAKQITDKYNRDLINFEEVFYLYPAKAEGRALRAVKSKAGNKYTMNYLKLKNKYLRICKNQEEHEEIIKNLKKMIASHKDNDKMKYLPNLETTLNNQKWEEYIDYEPMKGDNNGNWESI